MKKTLSFVAAMTVGLLAFAQAEVGIIDGESLTVGAGVEGQVLAETDNVKLTWGGDGSDSNELKTTSIKCSGFVTMSVDGVEGSIKGVTGSQNPKYLGENISSINTPATQGAQYDFSVAADGWLTIFIKATSNKAYYVWEGSSPVAYTFYGIGDNDKKVYSYTLPGDEYNWIDTSAADIDTYLAGEKMNMVESIVNKVPDAEASEKQNCFAYVQFPVFEGYEYKFIAAGSKASVGCFFFTVEQPKLITAADEDGNVTVLYSSDPSGVASVAADVKADNAMYNVLGVKVDNNYKGLVIKNGQKFYNR